MKRLALVLLLTGLAVPLRHESADAASPPPTTMSWYISSHWYNTYYHCCDGHSVWYDTGYYQANGNSMILDFGSVSQCSGQWGLVTWEYGCLPLSTVKADLQSVESGYEANSSHTQTLDLIVGTNDSCYYSSYNYDNFGTSLGQALDAVGDSAHVTLDAASDVEPQWSQPYGSYACSYNVPTSEANNVADGWNYQEYNGQYRYLYNYGWLDESSYDSVHHIPYYPYSWTASELNKLSWQGEVEFNFLEVYNASWGQQLTHLDLYGNYNSTGAWYVAHILAGQSFLAPDTAWSDTLSDLKIKSRKLCKSAPSLIAG